MTSLPHFPRSFFILITFRKKIIIYAAINKPTLRQENAQTEKNLSVSCLTTYIANSKVRNSQDTVLTAPKLYTQDLLRITLNFNTVRFKVLQAQDVSNHTNRRGSDDRESEERRDQVVKNSRKS